MDFTTPPRVAELLPQIRSFVAERILPFESRLDQDWAVLAAELEAVRGEVRRRGWWAPFLASEHGGMGLRLAEFAFVSEELGRTPLGHYAFHCQAPDVGNMEMLAEFGTPGAASHLAGAAGRGDGSAAASP